MLPPWSDLVHCSDKRAGENSEEDTGDELQQEAVQPHVQGEERGVGDLEEYIYHKTIEIYVKTYLKHI